MSGQLVSGEKRIQDDEIGAAAQGLLGGGARCVWVWEEKKK